MDELDLWRQEVFQPVPVDGVGVATAHLHDPHRLPGAHERGDLGCEPSRQLCRAILVDVLHAGP